MLVSKMSRRFFLLEHANQHDTNEVATGTTRSQIVNNLSKLTLLSASFDSRTECGRRRRGRSTSTVHSSDFQRNMLEIIK